MKNKRRRGLWLKFDRLLSQSLLKQFAILGVVLIIALGLSYLFLAFSGSDWEGFCRKHDLSMWLLPLYLLIDANALNNLYIDNGVHGWMLFASSLTFLFGAFIFNGAIIAMITTSIERRADEHKEGHLHYLKSGHYIIMGYDDMVPSIITHIFEKDAEAYVLMMSAVEAPIIKERLKKTFDEKLLKRIILNFGHRMSKEYYKDIHLESAEQIYIVGLRSLPTHDAINVECVDSICRYLKQQDVMERPKRITCVFEDLDTYAAFKTSEIFGDVKELGIEFVPYNFYAGWAKQVFVKRCHKDMDNPEKTIKYPAVYGKGYSEEDKTALTEDDPRFVHLVFVGTTNFAVAFAMEAAHVLHFPNFKTKGLKTLITFIDVKADKEKDEFIARNRHLFELQSYYYWDMSEGAKSESREVVGPSYFNEDNGYKEGVDNNFLDVEFEFIKGDIFSKKVQDVIRKWSADKEHQYLSIFLALANQRVNFAFSMNMPDEVYDNEIPVFIRQDRSDNFVPNLRSTDEKIKENKRKNTYSKIIDGALQQKTLCGRYANIYPFGMNETAYSADDKSLKRAKLINYLYCTANYDNNKFQGVLALDSMSKDQIWREAQEQWQGLSVSLKWSNLYNSYNMRIKLASLRAMRGLKKDDTSRDTWPLSDDEVEVMAQVEHNRWNVEKLLMGYRKAHKNEDKYVHADFASELKKNKERFIHHDIRPFKELGSIKELDREFSRYIPWIMRMTEDND